MLALMDVAAWSNRVDGDFLNPAALDRAHQLARKAVQLDTNLPLAHTCLGYVLMWKHQHEASITAFERGNLLNSNDVAWRFGLALVFAGDSRRAIEVLEASMRLDPFYEATTSFFLGLAHYMLKQYEQALPLLRECVSRSPNFRPAHVVLAATYARLGQLDEARAEAVEVLRIQPNYSIAVARLIAPFKQPRDDKHFCDGLRKAGIPE
jgi:adenylate cyclase